MLVYALAAIVISGAAMAQTGPAPATPTQAPSAPPSRCGEVPVGPAAPDPVTATAEQIQTAVASYDAWRAAVQPNMDCRRAEALELRAAADARAAEYNAANAAAQATGAAFQTAIDAYNARLRQGGRR